MKANEAKQILFIQGGGDGGYEADKTLVASLKTTLGKKYQVNFSELQSDESASDFGWVQQISERISETDSNTILVGHSLGASMILKFLSESSVVKKIEGVFLLATPFWSGDEDWKAGLKLQENFAEKLPEEMPLFLYHCQDDEEVPFSHFNQYKKKLTRANFREIESGGHQFNNDLALIAKDIKTL